MWVGICTTVIVLSFILTYKCQVAYEIPEENYDDDDEKKNNFYEKNLTEGNKLTLMLGTDNKDNEDKKESANGKNDKIFEKLLTLFSSVHFSSISFLFFYSSR